MKENKERVLTINIAGEGEVSVEDGAKLSELAERFGKLCRFPIMAARVDNDMMELHKKIREDCCVEFVDISNPYGYRIYQRTCAFLMVYAIKSVLGEKTRVVIKHSIKRNYYCEIMKEDAESLLTITPQLLEQISNLMHETAELDLPIERKSIAVDEATRLAARFGMHDKIKNLVYRRTANVNFYRMDWFYDYFYGLMAPSAGCVQRFKLIPEGLGFMLCFPPEHNPDNEISYDSTNFKKISEVLRESGRWAKILNTETVGELNDKIANEDTEQFVQINEALHEKRIAQIADAILLSKKRVVLIAGPSSSGKTTFAKRLCVQLRVNGLSPQIVSLDNYYLSRAEVPQDENGKPDFETIHGLDIPLINQNLRALLNGESVLLPKINFLRGEREYYGKPVSLPPNGILVVEGIHGLNNALTNEIDPSNKFKIFISALTQLNIDDHNRISTTDTRLIRRIVRDSRFRGTDAEGTLAMWQNVLKGEQMWIFPFQGAADAIFNSALIYEMCVLKQYAEPLLFKMDKTSPFYLEARRLIKFLDGFLGISGENIPRNSILREFIGGGSLT